MKPSLLITVIALMLCYFPAPAQRTTRSRLHAKQHVAEEPADTPIYIIPDAGSFIISGFDKPVNSKRATFPFTNITGPPVTELFLTINYTDTSARQLHRQSRRVIRTVTPGETLLIDYPSFDRQGSFYYHLSRKPRVQATPFDVTITVDSVRILPAVQK